MKTWLKVVIGIVVAVLLVGAVGGVVAWTQSDKFDQKTLAYIGRYKIGGLDSNGNYSNVNTSVYTADPFECQGLNCTLDFDAEVTYEIFFYDQNKDFVHRTGSLEKSFVEDSVPFFAKYARIVITPKDDNKVTSLEKDKYAKQLTIKVNREQGYKNYSENLVGKPVATNSYISFSTGELMNEGNHTTSVSDFIPISSYKEGLIFKASGVAMENNCVYCYDNHKNFIGFFVIGSNAKVVFESSESVYYYGLDFKGSLKYGQNANETHDTPISFVRVCFEPNAPIELYCR